MRTLIRISGLTAVVLALGLYGVAAAQNKAAAPAAPAKPVAATPAAPAEGKAKSDPAKGETGPALGESRDDLKKQLEAAHAKIAEDKKALAETRKGKDKDAIKAVQDKVKQDGKDIQDIQNKLHALKTGGAKAPAKDAAAPKPAK